MYYSKTNIFMGVLEGGPEGIFMGRKEKEGDGILKIGKNLLNL